MRDLLLKMLIFLLLFITGLPETTSLDIFPNDPEVILSLSSNFSLTCSGHNEVIWRKDNKQTLDTVMDQKGDTFVSTLSLWNVTGLHTGEYSCSYSQPPKQGQVEEKAIYIFVPDPSLPFLPSSMEDTFVFSGGHVENIIPCRVTNPNTPVMLYEKRVEDPVPATYNPRQGFKGVFEDMAYICRATLDGQEFDSIPYYVYIIQVSSSPASTININISAVQSTVKQGENITVICEVRDIELIDYTWSYPGLLAGKKVKPDTKFLPGINHHTSSTLTIHNAGLEDEGLYICKATETYHDQHEIKEKYIKVVERGFVNFLTDLNDTEFAELHKSRTFNVQIEAYPCPTIIWLQNNQPLTSESNSEFSISSRNLSETRYQTTLNLVRVKQSEGGFYTVRAFHEDDSQELSFYLQINELLTGTPPQDVQDKQSSGTCTSVLQLEMQGQSIPQRIRTLAHGAE